MINQPTKKTQSPKPKVAGSTPAGDTFKSLSANTADKDFLLGFMGFACVTRLATGSSASSDEMTANDTVCPRWPMFGATTGATSSEVLSLVGEASRASVPVARIVWRSVEGDDFQSSDGSESYAP